MVSSYIAPQALVFQEYNQQSSELVEALRAHISGPNVLLHRYDVTDERAGIDCGLYDHLADDETPWPGKTAGSVVVGTSVRVIIENALLMYLEDAIGSTTSGRGTVAPTAGYNNRVTSSTITFVDTDGNDRHALLLDRDVRVGDVVYLRSVDGIECDEAELWTRVTGFASTLGDSDVGDFLEDAGNAASVTATSSVTQTGGPVNCVTAVVNGGGYNGMADGDISETYTVTVVKSGIPGCLAARLRVVSSSGRDNVAEVTPAAFGAVTAIGTRGLTVTFDTTTGDCEDSASLAEVTEADFVLGQTWTVAVRQAFLAACAADSGSAYTGDFDDTYIIEVTKGGLWASLPEITVTTARGLDVSGPTIVPSGGGPFVVGSYGVTGEFGVCTSGTLLGLRLGDRFSVSVTSGSNGPSRTLILRDDLPTGMQGATDLDLRLFISKTVTLTARRLNAPPNVNYTIETTQVVLRAGATSYDTTWTSSGVQQALPVWSGRAADAFGPEFGRVYVQYNEYLSQLTQTVTFLSGLGDIDLIPGQLTVSNPLKWAAYRALQNANGSLVGVTAVADPTSLDSWQDVIDAVDGRNDIYNFVPLTRNREVLNLFQAQVATESTAERGNWKAMFVSLSVDTTLKVVGKSTAGEQLLRPTSTDGDVVLATLADNPQATGTQYTLLRVPENNSGFVTYNVRGGDIIRFLYSIDAFGDETYKEFVVDNVLSENSLLLLAGHTTAVSVPQKIEIHHTQSKNEMAAAIADDAQSFASNRVVAVWPDVAGTGGIVQAGFHLCAALAGLVSGVSPHQGLTNVEVVGFDDLAARTKNFFSRSQLDTLAAGGVWIVTEDNDGTPHTRHALTTSTIDLNRREEMIRRNFDSISYAFLNVLRPLIGRANVTPALLNVIDHSIKKTTASLSRVLTTTLGPQLISAIVRVDAAGNRILRIHPLAADRVEIVLDIVQPAPLNNAELHLVL